jgi:hypothetical protein
MNKKSGLEAKEQERFAKEYREWVRQESKKLNKKYLFLKEPDYRTNHAVQPEVLAGQNAYRNALKVSLACY